MAVELVNPQVRKIPGISVVYAGVGRPVDNDGLIREFEGKWKSEKERAQDIESLRGSGIVRRYKTVGGKLYGDAPEEVRQEMVGAATLLTENSLKSQGWDKADILIGVTSFPPDPKSEWIREVADRFGIRETGEVNATCNGSALALIEALKNPDYKGARIAITAYEPLAWCTSPDDFMSQAIFGNGGASVALERKTLDVMHARTTVQQDTEGVIKVPKSFEAEGFKKESAVASPWFEVAPGSEGIVTYRDRLVRIGQAEPVNDPYILEMNGQATAKYFTKLVTDALMSGLESYYGMGQEASENPIGLVVGHQPSKPVFNLVERRLGRELGKNPAFEGISAPDMPWVLEDAKISNISPGTVLVALGESLTRIRDRDRVFAMMAYGVGSSSSLFVARYLP
jgi:3-oxoacyl-[acyl-carrier-protein] synthase III